MAQLVTVELAQEECIKCGITFAMPRGYQRERRNDHKSFYCPSGHSQYYPQQTEEERLKKRLLQAQSNLDQVGASLRDTKKKLKDTENRRRAEKGAKTRIKNRVANGVCPCCNRHFTNLQRHMENQHPDFTTSTSGGAS